ncbi:MAG: SDR family oxidoreductase [Rickettsiales bacterium]|nr:SDR family oxidoreductase [Rickettsiales bacterium]
MNKKKDTKKALITGASRGIGFSIAELFSKNNIEVIAPTREQLDLSSEKSIHSFLEKNSALNVDILVNNAGINVIENISAITEDNLKQSLQINLIAPIALIKAFAPKMAQNNYGRIVNISSIWSQLSKPGRSVYSSAKSAINAFTRSSAVEFAANNVLVNSVAPGFVDTDLTRKNNSPEQIKAIESNLPIKRLAKTSEIAELVYFLSSEKNTYITGQTVFIDGGFSCQ